MSVPVARTKAWNWPMVTSVRSMSKRSSDCMPMSAWACKPQHVNTHSKARFITTSLAGRHQARYIPHAVLAPVFVHGLDQAFAHKGAERATDGLEFEVQHGAHVFA